MRLRLFAIVISQFFCTSIWFAVNGVVGEVATILHQRPSFLANITSAIQFGFICGTFLFALLAIADRYSPSRVFFVSALLAAAFNIAITIPGNTADTILVLRFLSGFFLAGIYPVGMKIAADHFEPKLGRALGFLVGALVLGTAFPHLLRAFTIGLSWKLVIYATTLFCLIGGLIIILFLPDGVYRKPRQQFDLFAFLKGFHSPDFRAAAFGYFGHMWELYTFWAFLPLMITAWKLRYNSEMNVSFWSFLIIAFGTVACITAGLLSQKIDAKKLATIALTSSFSCCVLSPLFLFSSSVFIFFGFLFFWGFAVIADSPLFSSLVAKNAPAVSKGSSLTIVNCIGFFFTIVSIQFLNAALSRIDMRYLYILLGIGPALGILALVSRRNSL